MTNARSLGPTGRPTGNPPSFPSNAIELSRVGDILRIRVMREDAGVSMYYCTVGGVLHGVGGSVQLTSLDLSRLYRSGAIPVGLPVRMIADLGGQQSLPYDDIVYASPDAEEAPTNTRAPVIESPVYIGRRAILDGGDWDHMEAGTYAIEWRSDGVPVAQVRDYVPVPEDDLHELTVTITATNNEGSLSVTTAAVTVTFAPPVVTSPLEDVFGYQGGPSVIVDVAGAFAVYDEEGLPAIPDGVNVYGLSGGGGTIDPVTGEATFGTGALLDDVLVTVSATNSGGTAENTFRITITAEEATEFPPFIPANLWHSEEVRDSVADQRKRRAQVDESVAVPGGFTLEWSSSRNEAGDPSATTQLTPGDPPNMTMGTYSLGDEMVDWLFWKRTEDGATAYAVEEPIRYTIKGAYPAPSVVTPQADISVTQNATDPIINLRNIFNVAGNEEGFTFSVTAGTGYTLDQDTDTLVIDTSSAKTENFTVQADTFQGSISDTFEVDIVSTGGATAFPPDLTNAQWITEEERDNAPAGRIKCLVTGVSWNTADFDLLFSPTEYPEGRPDWAKVMLEDVPYTTQSTSDEGTELHVMMFWRRRDGGEVKLAHPIGDKRIIIVQGLKAPPPPTGVYKILDSVVNRSVDMNLFKLYHKSYYGERNPANTLPAPVVMGLRLMHSDHAGARNRLIAQIRSSIGSTGPLCMGGYTQQYDIIHAAALTFGRRIPSVWGALTATEKEACDALMEAILICGVYSSSDNNAKTKAGVNMKDFLNQSGYKRNWASNFRMGMIGSVLIPIPYFGGVNQTLSVMNSFNLSTLKTKLGDYGLTNAKKSYDGIGNSGGPTLSDINQCITNFKIETRPLSDLLGIVAYESEKKVWRRNIMTGLGGTSANGWIGSGTNGRGKLQNSNDNAGLPNKGVKAMQDELDASDADGDRSSMSYAMGGARAEGIHLCVLTALGYLTKDQTGMAALMNRLEIGVGDLKYKTKEGYLSYAKGGGGGSEGWTQSWADTNYAPELYWEMVEFLKGSLT